ncbi:MAG: hypothetical protein ACI4UE_06880 [Candidatus Scatovivens sp.]
MAVTGIEVCVFKTENETIDSTTYTNERLMPLTISLSEFLEENPNTPVYFKAVTNRSGVEYNKEELKERGLEVTKIKIDYEQIGDIICSKVKETEEEKTTIIKVKNLTQSNLNTLKVAVNNSNNEELYSLNFEYKDKTKDDDGNDKYLYLKTSNAENKENDIYSKEYYEKHKKDEENAEVSELTSMNATVENKIYGEIKEKISKTLLIDGTKYSSYKDLGYDSRLKLYSVQKVKEQNEETFYLDDYKIVFYNPIYMVDIETKYMSYITGEGGKSINAKGRSYSGVYADLTNVGKFELLETVEGFSINNDKIFSSWSSNDLDELLNRNQETLKIKVTLSDIAGTSKIGNGEINLGIGNFEILANDNTNVEDKNRFKATLEDAYEYAKNLNKSATIIQIIENYTQTTDFIVSDFNKINNNCLTYDMNGNTLIFANDKHIKINKENDFTLTSSSENGNIKFNHEATSFSEMKDKKVGLQDFKNAYPEYENIDAYLKIKYGITSGVKLTFGRIKYLSEFTSNKIKALNEFLHSFNQIGWNVNYNASLSAIVNYGNLKFESGKIVLTTSEQVASYGSFGGGAVLNIANALADVIRAFGIDILDITDLSGSYAQIENTAIGIENYGTVILGSGEQKGITEANVSHPEIVLKVNSKELEMGLSTGNIRHPNKVVSVACGVWNKDNGTLEGPTTIMNSGFMLLSLLNNTNSWWSVFSVGKTYGIYNEKGTTTINGVTKKDGAKNDVIYGIAVDFVDYIINNMKESAKEGEKEQAETGLRDILEKQILTGEYYGFCTYSQLQLVSKLTGAIYYTRSYAVCYPDGTNIPNNVINTDITQKEYRAHQLVQNGINYYLNLNTIFGNIFSQGMKNLNDLLFTGWTGNDKTVDDIILSIFGAGASIFK